jgi:hypothetical protein
MKELISEEQAEMIVMWLAIVVTVFSLAFTAWRTSRLPKPGRKLLWVQGSICALVGPVIWIFWKVYNSIENHYGLDSLKALGINFLIAIGIGLVFAVLFYFAPRLVLEPSGTKKRK